MPNGDMHEDRPLNVQVRDLMSESALQEKALCKAITIIKTLIKENREIRRLAKLPEGDYPEYLTVGSNHWRLT